MQHAMIGQVAHTQECVPCWVPGVGQNFRWWMGWPSERACLAGCPVWERDLYGGWAGQVTARASLAFGVGKGPRWWMAWLVRAAAQKCVCCSALGVLPPVWRWRSHLCDSRVPPTCVALGSSHLCGKRSVLASLTNICTFTR
eukprot:365992-Chlamydomonas_euryale.AAC.9